MISDIMQKLGNAKLLPVIKIEQLADAIPLVNALCAGGLPVAEITFRTTAAAAAIKAIGQELPDVILGAGTILTTTQVDEAVAAGAKYLVSPGFNPKVVEYAIAKGVPITPGVCTPSEVEQATSMGLSILKFFPAEQFGGVAMLKTFYSVYPHVRFIPTGGITVDNLAQYLAQPNIHAVGGTWMVHPEMIKAKDWQRVKELAQEASAILQNMK